MIAIDPVADERTATREIRKIVLVSGSPRRRELVEQLRLSYTVFEPNADESVAGRVRPREYVRTIARRKMSSYVDGLERNAPNAGTVADWALAADTVVVIGRRIIGKPADANEAEAVLRRLSGRSHRVITALALYNPVANAVTIRTAVTRVVFTALSEEEIRRYLGSGEWKDAAGGYRIQERGSVLVRKIVGSYSNVVGLPLETFYGMVRAQGFRLFPSGE